MNLGEGDCVVAVATTNGKTMDEQNGIEDDVEESEEQETEAQEEN
jgi:hypothetical protein